MYKKPGYKKSRFFVTLISVAYLKKNVKSGNMMNTKMKIQQCVMVAVIVSCNVSSIFGYGKSTDYNNAALNSMYEAIHTELLDVSTNEVARRAGTSDDVAENFKEKFLKDPVGDAQISQKRKTQRIMKEIRKAEKTAQASGFVLGSQVFREDIAIECQEKEESLEGEIDGLWRKKVGATAMIVGGVMLVGIATQCKRDGVVFAGIGSTAVLGGGAGWAYLWNRETKLRTHITQVQTAKNGWEASFKK
jgi:hypothetical protein